MKLFYVFILLFLVFSGEKAFSQQSLTFKSDKENREQSKLIAIKQISDFKNSVLLVRLRTGKNSIEAMRKAGNFEMADKRQKQIDDENKNIIRAFRSAFDFCPVYFFYSDYSESVTNHKFDSVQFLNDSLQHDKTVNISNEIFFIAEFASVKGDTVQYYSHSVYQPSGNFSQEPTPIYYGGGTTGAFGLIIKDSRFYQLRKPFPFFVNKSSFRKDERAISVTVEKMNRNLWGFYKMVPHP